MLYIKTSYTTYVAQINMQYILNVTGGGTDYTSGPYTVTFSAKSTRASFDVSITNDTLLERDETFILTIDLTSLPSKVTVGISNSSTVTIMDDEGK